jgi:His/Glu/Gln/Arg/opine family amino acid ABC transporter permease subunit
MKFDFSVLDQYWQVILHGWAMTVAICASALPIAFALGIIFAVMRHSRHAPLRAVATVYVEVIRNIPFMIQIFLLVYLLPAADIRLPTPVVGALGLAVFSSAYFVEIIRAAIRSVPHGQVEAARAAGMSRGQAMRRIVFPQMMGFLIPPATNQTISLLKESSILSTITVAELTMTAHLIQSATFRVFEVLVVIAIIYWGMSTAISVLARYLERGVQARTKRPRPAARVASSVPAPRASEG